NGDSLSSRLCKPKSLHRGISKIDIHDTRSLPETPIAPPAFKPDHCLMFSGLQPSPSPRQIYFLFSRRFPEGTPPLCYTGICKAAELLIFACTIGGSDRRKLLSRVLQRGRRSRQERYPMRLRVLKAP